MTNNGKLIENNSLSRRLTSIQFYLTITFLISLPFLTVLNSAIIFILFITSIISIILTNKEKRDIQANRNLILVLSGLFFTYLVSFIISWKSSNWLEVEKRFSLMIFPIIFGCQARFIKAKEINTYILTFLITTLVAALYTFKSNTALLFEQNMEIEESLVMNRPYFGLYIYLSCGFAFYLFLQNKNIVAKSFLVIGAIFLFYFSYLIFAKMAIISFIITIVLIFLIYYFKKTEKKTKAYSLGIVFLILFSFIVFQFLIAPSSFRNIFSFFSTQEYNINVVASSEIRQMIWKCVFEILQVDNNWIWGVGLGKSDYLLDQCYLVHYSYHEWFLNEHFNAHNQYLETWLSTGLLGSLILLTTGVVSIKTALKHNNYLYLFFIILFLVCCLTESFLERQKGIVLFSFFNSLFAFGEPVSLYRKIS